MFSQNTTGFILPKNEINKLLTALKKYGEIIAPKKHDEFLRLGPINNEKEIVYEGIAWYTPKEYVFPQKQTVFEYQGAKITKPQPKDFPKTVLFGMRLCDLNSFKINDKLFLEQEPKNYNYENFRKNLTLVGFWCNEQQDKYCFCDSMDLVDYYDLCLFDKGKDFHIKSNSQKGEEILKSLKLKQEQYEKQLPNCETKLNTTQIKDLYDKNEWQANVDDCLSCGTCTAVCPTCLCFDVSDKVNLDLKSGIRIAKWDSCMYKDFTLVAGGHQYRDARADRFKHRIYHKLVYFPKKFDNQLMCTGCGRCVRACPNKIDWINTINVMEASKNEQ